jgi:hypothetical protein
MFLLKVTGSVLGSFADQKFLGGFAKRNLERGERGLFYIRLARAVLAVRKEHAEAISAEIVKAVREATPVDQGNLRDSVRFVGNSRGGRITSGGTPATMKKFRDGNVTFDQALGIEYGTTERAAQPHFWPTVRQFEKRIERSLGRKLEKDLGE